MHHVTKEKLVETLSHTDDAYKIAEMLHCSVWLVYKRLAKHGLTIPRKFIRFEDHRCNTCLETKSYKAYTYDIHGIRKHKCRDCAKRTYREKNNVWYKEFK